MSSRFRRGEHIHLELPDLEVLRSRHIAERGDGDQRSIIQDPERVALVGPNGAGRSTLIEHLFAGSDPDCGTLLTDRVGYLPVSQDYPVLHRLGIETVVELDGDGGMRRRDSLYAAVSRARRYRRARLSCDIRDGRRR
ncbi:ATP-binding cassette domain-containing protein [Nocardia otitidiscaviarum]|uniref:ATP-binding cassette domain-containing protein n=1 Tax=Nocardia otitidiscaviarum TaxID=1823 RepID=UPI0004A74AFD|nr:ATP-binding cassette domain-containing protein [Nocardia otitidiscaviarum]